MPHTEAFKWCPGVYTCNLAEGASGTTGWDDQQAMGGGTADRRMNARKRELCIRLTAKLLLSSWTFFSLGASDGNTPREKRLG